MLTAENEERRLARLVLGQGSRAWLWRAIGCLPPAAVCVLLPTADKPASPPLTPTPQGAAVRHGGALGVQGSQLSGGGARVVGRQGGGRRDVGVGR